VENVPLFFEGCPKYLLQKASQYVSGQRRRAEESSAKRVNNSDMLAPETCHSTNKASRQIYQIADGIASGSHFVDVVRKTEGKLRNTKITLIPFG
jgi:hypothetical protein